MTHPHAAEIAQALVDWFRQCGRDYPWRRTRDPWAILVSEVMLQQTTIPTVLGRYEEWMRRFPTPAALAAVSEEEALRSWEGLGYYRRVRALQATARAVTEKHGGIFPTDETALRALPGVGEYTVGAVLSFACNRPVPLVDANVARVFARLCNDSTPVDSPAGRRRQWELATAMVHRTEPRAYNSALMELGQTVCTGGEPDCPHCPLQTFCLAETPAELPKKLPKKELIHTEHHDIWVLTEAGLLLEKQADDKRHAGMYRLPQRPAESVAGLPLMATQKYSVTRYRVTRRLYNGTGITPAKTETFIPLCRLAEIPLASPDRKLLNRFLPK